MEAAPAPPLPLPDSAESKVAGPLEVGEFGWCALRLHLPSWEFTDTEDVECVVLQKGAQGTLIGVPLRGETAVSDEAPRFTSTQANGQTFICTAVRVPGVVVSRPPIPPGRREVSFRFPEAACGPSVVRGFYSSEGFLQRRRSSPLREPTTSGWPPLLCADRAVSASEARALDQLPARPHASPRRCAGRRLQGGRCRFIPERSAKKKGRTTTSTMRAILC